MKNSITSIAIGSLAIVGATAIGYILNASYKMHRVAKRLNIAIDGILSSDIDIQISERIVEEAVETAAYREARELTKSAADKVAREVHDDISSKVRRAIDSAYSDVKDEVLRELKKKVGKVDISEIRNKVVEEAKERAAEMFEEELYQILEDFNDNLKNVSRIYSSIAETMAKKS